MSNPVDSARPTTSVSSAATTHNINVGSPIYGDLLLVLWRAAAAPGTVTFTGYTPLNGASGDSSDASDDSTFIFYRRAIGTEGTTDPLTTQNSVKSAAICWVIKNAQTPTIQAPERSTVMVFTTSANAANPTVVTPTGGSKTYLFIAVAGIDQESTTFSALTNYVNLVNANSGTTGSVATNCIIGGGTRQLTASSEDPGAFTHGAAATGGCSYVIAIHPPDYTKTGAGVVL